MELNSYEYSVEPKKVGRLRFLRTLLIIGYFIFVLAYFVIIYVTRIIPLGALIPLMLWILVFFTWRYVKPEHKYNIESGIFTYTVIYGSKTKKVKTSFRVSQAERIAPVSHISSEIADFGAKKVYNTLPSKDCESAYAMLFRNNSGVKCVLYLQVDANALKILKFYNSNTVVDKSIK